VNGWFLNLKFVECRHAGENRHPDFFASPGFRVAPAIASLPGMTIYFAVNFRSRNSLLFDSAEKPGCVFRFG
jgi:hypothetical protein